jgi:beta-aspartyl-peptidase (threonine type)
VHGGAQGASKGPQQEIQIVLDKQIVAWNRGDLEGFMAGYWKSPDLVYLSNKTVVRGWQTLLDRYRQLYQPPNESKMGALSLPEEEIVMLGRDSAIVWGAFVVKTSDGKARGGLYTLAMRKLPEGWRTVYDRTSIEQQSQSSIQPSE